MSFGIYVQDSSGNATYDVTITGLDGGRVEGASQIAPGTWFIDGATETELQSIGLFTDAGSAGPGTIAVEVTSETGAPMLAVGPILNVEQSFDLVVDPIRGNDDNPGTPDAPFATLDALERTLEGIRDPDAALTVYVESGSYTNQNLELVRFAGTLDLVFGPETEIIWTSDEGRSAFSASSDSTVNIYGNGLEVSGFNSGTGNGVGVNHATLRAYDIHVSDVLDGFSAHGTGHMEVYRSSARDAHKFAVAHVNSSSSYHEDSFFQPSDDAVGLAHFRNDQSHIVVRSTFLAAPSGSAASIRGDGNTLISDSLVGTPDAPLNFRGEGLSLVDSHVYGTVDSSQSTRFESVFGGLSVVLRDGGSISITDSSFDGRLAPRSDFLAPVRQDAGTGPVTINNTLIANYNSAIAFKGSQMAEAFARSGSSVSDLFVSNNRNDLDSFANAEIGNAVRDGTRAPADLSALGSAAKGPTNISADGAATLSFTVDIGPLAGTVPGAPGNGTPGNDVLAATRDGSRIDGGEGNDLIAAGSGQDVLIGGSGNDTLSYADADGRVVVRLWNHTASGDIAQGDTIGGFENITGGRGDDVLIGSMGRNVINGGSGDDYLDGLRGNNVLRGGSGDDILISNAGADRIFGGSGSDTVSYAAANGAVTIRLWNQTASGDLATGDRLSSMENAITGSGKDAVIGSQVANRLVAGSGDDYLDGLGGDDHLSGGAGADMIIGGAGIDTLDYGEAGGRIVVRLWNQTIGGSIAEGDTLSGIENVITGAGRDALIGDRGANSLAGGAGNDYLDGLGGADTLHGGAGDDRMIGGTGADTFVISSGDDVILDFSSVEGDRLDLSGIDGIDTLSDLQSVHRQVGRDSVFTFADGSTLTVEDTRLPDLSDALFAADLDAAFF